MRFRWFTFIVLAATAIIIPDVATAGEWSGHVALEGRWFPQEPLFPDQRSNSGSVAAQPEYYHEWDGGNSVTVVPFLRLDSADPERRHADLRELFFLWVWEHGEVGIGVRKVFWGVTESQHLVDIINQTDLVEFPDGEEKLGQPMVNLSIPGEWGTLDLFVLPYFRERTFPGRRGRLRSEPVVDTDLTEFESGAEEYHVDAALRYSKTIDNWDVGLSLFRGTSREPTLLPGTDGSGAPVLTPFYEQIIQPGLDLQWVAGAWLWKLEAIHRSGQGDGFFAWTGGFEYTFTSVAGSRMDLGVLGEWLHDTRSGRATMPFEEDIMGGVRLAMNDPASTEILFGMIQDLDTPSRVFTLEASRRLGNHWTLEIEALVYDRPQTGDLLYALRNDDVVQLTLAYHF